MSRIVVPGIKIASAAVAGIVGLLALTTGASCLAAEEASHPIHEGPSVSIPANTINFIATGVKTEKGELFAGPAYGDMQHRHHGTFVRMPHGFVCRPASSCDSRQTLPTDRKISLRNSELKAITVEPAARQSRSEHTPLQTTVVLENGSRIPAQIS